MGSGELRIADAIHGTVVLTPLEARVVGSRAFQRLRNVKQLGLAHLVYPGADYSRFPHSIGACHVAGRILEAPESIYIDTRMSTTPIKHIYLNGARICVAADCPEHPRLPGWF